MKQSTQQISDEIEYSTSPEQYTQDPLSDKEPTQELSHDDSDEDERKLRIAEKKPFGNMIVLSKTPHLSLGPDYWCFIPAIIAFGVVTYLVTALVFTTSSNLTFRLVTLVICLGHLLAYLATGLGNPGVILQSAEQGEANVKECTKCKLIVPRHARHCSDCNVCVGNYDHHCPWTSKCIGGGNLIRFYIFLGMTPIYMIYITIAFVVCMSNNLTRIQHLPKSL